MIGKNGTLKVIFIKATNNNKKIQVFRKEGFIFAAWAMLQVMHTIKAIVGARPGKTSGFVK